jgi:outer membrane receptor for ferrienterochelin and colicins
MLLVFKKLLSTIIMKKYLIIIIIILIHTYELTAQSASGYVFESLNNEQVPLEGATIIQLNTSNGTITSENGFFEINLIENQPKIIVVSFVSYVNDTIKLSQMGYNDINIVLNEAKELNEVEILSRTKGSSVSRANIRSVVNINDSELQKAACCTLAESFENSTTVDITYSDAVTGAKKIQMLGLDGSYTQLLIENTPNLRGLATPWGLDYIPGSWMESIQVSKGTSSVINGYESMTGQINVEYKKADEGEKFFLNGYGNSEGKFEGNLNTRFTISDKLSTAFLAHAENMSVKHDNNNDSFLDQPLKSQINLFNRWRYVNNQFRARLGIKYLTEDRQGGQMTFDPDKERTTENGYGIGVKTNRYEGIFKMGYVFKSRSNTNIGFQNQLISHDQVSYFGLNNYNANQLSYYSNLMFHTWISNCENQITTGVSLTYDKYEENLNDSIFDHKEVVPGAFMQYTYSNSSNLSIIVGLRLDNNSNYGLLFTPRLHTKYNLNENNVIRMSLGKGYRSPNVIAENTSMLATSKKLSISNDLDIESSWNYGLSYSSYFDIGSRELSLTADIFRTEFENQVIIDRESDAYTIFIYNLDGSSYSNSFQIEANYEIIKFLDVTMAFRYNDVKTTIAGNLVEKPLINKYKGLLAVSYQTSQKKWQFDLNLQVLGNQRLPNTDFYPPEYQKSDYAPNYAILNAQVTRYLNKFELYVGSENLGNYRQTDPIIAADDPFGKYFDSSIVWGPISGIKIFAGFRFKIE